MSALAPTLEAYFTGRLIGQRRASPHTVAAYRDAWRLLLSYAVARAGKQPSQLDIADLDAPLIAGFLPIWSKSAATAPGPATRGCPPSARSTSTRRCATPSTPG